MSSYSLAYQVDGTRFKAAIFTNLTQDHLDFHADLDDYWLAKRRLFTPAFTPLAVINLDDPHGRLLASTAGIATVTCGTAADADWRATDVTASLEGTGFRLRSPAGSRPVRLRLAGQFNAVNALGALAAADAIGIDLDTAVAGLEALAGVPGRFERVDAGQPFTVLVDYAHTPDSLDNVLGPARRSQGTGDRGLRLRRRPRPGQAAAHGRDRRPPGRPGRGHPLRQPSLRGPGGDRRSGRRGGGGRRRAGRVPGRGRPPGRHPGRPGHGRAGRRRPDHRQGPRAGPGVRWRPQGVPFDDRQVAAEAQGTAGVRPEGSAAPLQGAVNQAP